jgi:hypothetical protein
MFFGPNNQLLTIFNLNTTFLFVQPLHDLLHIDKYSQAIRRDIHREMRGDPEVVKRRSKKRELPTEGKSEI